MAAGPLAAMLRTDPQTLVQKSKRGVIERRLRCVTHAQRSPVYFYNVQDAIKVFGPPPRVRTSRLDCTGGYVNKVDAAALLRCSVSTIYRLFDKGSVKRIMTLFKQPELHREWGYRLKDLMALKQRQYDSAPVQTYEEETVTASRVVRKLVHDESFGSKVDRLADQVRAGSLSEEAFAKAVLRLKN